MSMQVDPSWRRASRIPILKSSLRRLARLFRSPAAWLSTGLVLLCLCLGSTARAQKFSTAAGFPTQDGGSAPEGMIAVGPNHILVMTHVNPAGISFYQKSTKALLASYLTMDFFGDQGAGDPVVHYDATFGRFLILAMGTGNNQLYLAVSKVGADPTVVGNWWKYHVACSSNIDYPGLGVSSDKLVLTAGEQAVVLDRASAYDGVYPQQPDLVTLSPAQMFTLGYPIQWKACRNLSADATIHLVGLELPESSTPASDVLWYRSITGPPSSPTLSAESVVLIAGDVQPPAGEQPGAPQSADCQPKPLESGYRLPDVYMRNGNVTAAWGTGVDYGTGRGLISSVHCVRFRASDRAVLDDFVVGAPGTFTMFPSAIEDKQGAILLGYDRYSAGECPSSAMIARRGGQQSGEYLVKGGLSAYIRCRNMYQPCTMSAWGDYTSMTIDETASTTTLTRGYYLGQWARNSSTGGTFVGLLTATYGNCGISGTVLSDFNGARSPRSGVPVVLVQSGQTADSTVTDANGAFSFGMLATGTYVLRMAWNPAVGLEATDGTGAYRTLVRGPTEIEITLKSGNQCVGNQFVVTQQSMPHITSITPVSGLQSSGVSLTVTGSGFGPASVVRFDGRLMPTAYDPGTGVLTANIGVDQVSHYGTHFVSVFTAAALGSGLSNRAPYLVLPPYFAAATLGATAACPAGDGGHIVATATLQDAATCGVSAATATVRLVLTQVTGSGFAIWQGATVDPWNPARYTVEGTATDGPAPGQRTFSFDVAKISGCGTIQASFQVTTTIALTVTMPDLDLRSYDLDPSVHGAVDQYDSVLMGQLLGTGAGCGDFDRNGSTDASDLAAFAGHIGHRGQEKRVIAPNGGELLNREIYGGEVPFWIRWVSGDGPQAKVTINLIDGATSTNIVTDAPDNGSYEWLDYCGVAPSTTKKIEVIYSAGSLPPGNTTPGVYLGFDRSDATFRILHECPSGLRALPDPETRELPRQLELGPPRPNPTTGEVAIRFALPVPAEVRIGMFDAAGRVVRELVQGSRAAGWFEARWDLTGRDGRRAAPGVYFCRMRVGDWTARRKLVISR